MLNRGFTLLELIVVLLIGGLMLTIAPPLMSSLGITTEVRSAARQLASGLRAARNQAITKQQEAVITVDLEARRFELTGDKRSVTLPDDEAVQVKLYTAQSELIDSTRGRIRFFPDGSSTGGYIALLDGRSEYRINVDWLTGRVLIDKRALEP